MARTPRESAQPMGGDSHKCPFCPVWVRGNRNAMLRHAKTEHPTEYAVRLGPAEAQKEKDNVETIKEFGTSAQIAKLVGKRANGSRTTKEAREPRPCGCGCGVLANRDFLQGHDARLRGRILKELRAWADDHDGQPLGFRVSEVPMADWVDLATFHKGMFAALVELEAAAATIETNTDASES